ncbi:plasmid mobilization relaxosome protein MobC [Paenibacillus sp. F411]|uniref:plasmid mobilization protein n=1 Tax=Paenibacillus sp. F411 TaxID=2820239 RepID=UPI001AAF5DB5|nr:plasmid mobilization relaxosome protein MobC [Paenibacillus sp. F411]MBO2946003.1 plasmid mobilization relaxosome protein MobC [Paenibacillus sp. F411]
MCTRNIKIMVCLNEKERNHLVRQVNQSGLSQEALVRALIISYIPKPLSPLDYHTLIRELHTIENNLNQLAVKAHTTGHLEREAFQQEANQFRNAVLQIQKAVTEPELRIEH